MKEKISIFFRTIGTALILGATPLIAGAQPPEEYELTKEGIQDILESVRDWFAAILGVIAVIMILYGAFLYLTAGGDEEKTGRAKKTLLYGAVGVLIIILAYGVFGLIISFLE